MITEKATLPRLSSSHGENTELYIEKTWQVTNATASYWYELKLNCAGQIFRLKSSPHEGEIYTEFTSFLSWWEHLAEETEEKDLSNTMIVLPVDDAMALLRQGFCQFGEVLYDLSGELNVWEKKISVNEDIFVFIPCPAIPFYKGNQYLDDIYAIVRAIASIASPWVGRMTNPTYPPTIMKQYMSECFGLDLCSVLDGYRHEVMVGSRDRFLSSVIDKKGYFNVYYSTMPEVKKGTKLTAFQLNQLVQKCDRVYGSMAAYVTAKSLGVEFTLVEDSPDSGHFVPV